MSPSPDLEDQEWEDIPLESTDLTMVASLIAEEQAAQILHEWAQVPEDHNPFPYPQTEVIFKDALERLQEMEHIPSCLDTASAAGPSTSAAIDLIDNSDESGHNSGSDVFLPLLSPPTPSSDGIIASANIPANDTSTPTPSPSASPVCPPLSG
ncbi:hypothetical protein F5J12DRAFT_897314 [Pisolithus orientalis]|uniref:uncharacterized protein n=1 Tax=Pisolithus orientalis TaxID=936130 RepID=UPI0022242188|nr:uncharacterized protein F5J12DRAFT_897314 [Pisolithus orientalis]KAI5992294.1 hypothetical protein F5J12DRAFT_897314 [Pisolithus orientalis]